LLRIELPRELYRSLELIELEVLRRLLRGRVLLEGGGESDLKRWIECDLGGCLIGTEGSLGLLEGRLGELMGRGYGLFPGISHVK
jgi:hypothetical protein